MARNSISVESSQDAHGRWYAIASITFPTEPVQTELRGEYTHNERGEAERLAVKALTDKSDYKRLAKKFS